MLRFPGLSKRYPRYQAYFVIGAVNGLVDAFHKLEDAWRFDRIQATKSNIWTRHSRDLNPGRLDFSSWNYPAEKGE